MRGIAQGKKKKKSSENKKNERNKNIKIRKQKSGARFVSFDSDENIFV
jgi:hypothetical protein